MIEFQTCPSQFLHTINAKISWHKGFICAFLLLVYTASFTQTRASLEQQRNTLIKQIDKTSETLKVTQKNRAQAIKQYDLLENQIENRKSLIENLNSSLELVDQNLSNKEKTIDSLENNYLALRNNYNELLQIQLRKRYLDNPVLILFSSNSLNDAMSKWRYFQQFKDYFNLKSEELISYQSDLKVLIDTLSHERENKIKLLEIENEQASNLEDEKSQKNKILKSLSESEKKLKLSLNRQKEEREKLNKVIEEIIIREMEIAKKANSAKSEDAIKSNTKLDALKGKLSWPVNGKITAWFGKHDHPEMKNVKIENNGIDITTNPHAEVKNIFEGTVVTVSQIPGHQNMVMIQHGVYYSVYTKLDKVFVEPGDKIKSGGSLGQVFTNSKNETILHFEIWKGKNKENPSRWLKL